MAVDEGGNGNSLQYSCLGNPEEEESGGLQSMGSQSQTLRLNNNCLHGSGGV